MASITVNTNGQTLTVNASLSHWTSAALAVVASGDDDIPNTATTTITSNYTMHFANTATTVTITVKQLDGTTLLAQAFEVNPGIGARTLNPLPDDYKVAADLSRAAGLSLAPAGALAETCSRVDAVVGNGSVLATGRLSVVAINLQAGITISSITFVSATTALDTGTHQWFALYDSSQVLLRQTANDTSTAWAANTAKTLALTSSFTTTYSGLHYLGINVTATTPPSLFSMTSNTATLGIPPIIAATADSSLVGTAPNPAGTFTAAARVPYAYVS